MSVVLSHSLILKLDPEVDGSSPAAPMIGWDNKVSGRSITATSQMLEHPADVMGNPSTAEYWAATSAADQTITVALAGAPTEVSYIGLARHNLGSSQTTVRVMCKTGGEWVQVLPDFIPADDSVLFARIEPVMAEEFQLILTGSNKPVRIAVLSAGRVLLLQRNIYVGHTPLPYGREVKLSSGVSESGQFQGRIVMGMSHSTSVSLKHLTPDWYRRELDPFIEASAELPFFFAWRPNDYPFEVGYCWMKGMPEPTNQLNNGMMEISLSMEGIVRKNSKVVVLDPMRR